MKTEQHTRPVGRPPMNPDDVKVVTPVRLVQKEKAAYERAAGKAGLKLSEWIRSTLNDAVKK